MFIVKPYLNTRRIRRDTKSGSNHRVSVGVLMVMACWLSPWDASSAASPPAPPSHWRTEPFPPGCGSDVGDGDPVYWREESRRVQRPSRRERVSEGRKTLRHLRLKGNVCRWELLVGTAGGCRLEIRNKREHFQSTPYYFGVRRSRNFSLTSRTTSVASVSGSLIFT